jgi:hypothetical protein
VRTNLERVAHVVVTVVAGAIHGQRFFLAVHLFFGELRSAVSVERGGLLQLDEGFGLFTHMKSAVLAAIFGITGGVAILLAVPAEENATVVKILPAKWTGEYGAPVVPQIEEEEVVPELLEHYSVAQTKTEKPAPRRHRHVARLRPNFFEKLVAGFVKLQKHQPSKSIL